MNATVTFKPGQFFSYKEVVLLPRNVSVEVYPDQLTEWIRDNCGNEIYDILECKGENYGITAAVEDLYQEYWHSDQKLIEYALKQLKE